MKRIDIHYGGQIYSIGGREPADLIEEIETGIIADEPRWLVVNDGEGSARPALLLLTRGVAIGVVPIPDELP